MMKAAGSNESDPDPRALCAAGLDLHTAGRYRDAIARFRQALAVDPQLAEAHNLLGRSLNNLQRFDEAAAAFRESLRLRPDYAEAHSNLGHVLRAQGELEGAADAFDRALRIDPRLARAHHNLGTVRNAQGRFEDAVECIRRGLEIDPEDAVAWTNLGDLLSLLDRRDKAIAAYRRSIAIDGRFIDAHVNLGSLMQALRKVPEATAAYREALAIDPAHGAALAGMAGMMELGGRYAEALALIEPHVDARPCAALVIAHARLLRRVGRRAEAVDRLQKLLTSDDLTPGSIERAHFVLGDLHDDLGEYERAFGHYSKANAAGREEFEPERFAEGVESLIEFFTPAALSALPRSGNASELPVFIVGMPRSGTSLVEQILASHRAVHACGERTDLHSMVREMSGRLGSPAPYPYCLRRVDAQMLAELSEQYLQASGTLEAGTQRVTDKLPANFLNLGLIELLFPRARIIHCRRHPLDTAVSCYFQHFASRGQAFSARLEHIGTYMNLYRRVMAHWRRVVSLMILEIDYESLVAEPEAVSRRMIAFLGLEWDPACLRFHELDRVVVTASHAQVREPVYRRSVGRHRPYLQYLRPLLDVLGSPHDQPI